MRLPLIGRCLVYLLALIASSGSARAASYEIVTVGGANGPGARPAAGVVLGPDGNYYGTTTEGGAFGGGTVFRLAPDGTLSTVVSFPYAEGNATEALTVGSDGNLYGTTLGPVSGPNSKATIFRVTLAGERTVLATFVNGNPRLTLQRLVEASDGNLYGAITNSGTQGFGELFRITKQGAMTSLVTFTGPNGAFPDGGLIEAADGNLYGTTRGGGANNGGTVYRITKSGAFATLAHFASASQIGIAPVTELTQGADGSLYGVTSNRTSPNGYGSVFRVTLSGELTMLGALPSYSSGQPSPLAVGDDGNLYGTTPNHYYRVSPAGGLTVLISFGTKFEGRRVGGPLLKVGNGRFLGTTAAGGRIGVNSFGIIHQLTEEGAMATRAAFPPPLSRHFVSELSEVADGQLYATADDDRSGGSWDSGSLGGFKLDLATGAMRLISLPTLWRLDAPGLSSRVVRAANGDLYGTVSEGGYSPPNYPLPNAWPTGFIYRITNDRASAAFQFSGRGAGAPNDTGDAPTGVVAGPDGHLYGTAQWGGGYGQGTFFKLDLEGNFSLLASFGPASPAGSAPHGDLIWSDGYFYGHTQGGGQNNSGTIFKASPQGTVTPLVSLPPNTGVAYGSRLLLGNDGALYGVTYNGGAENRGMVFRVTKTGVLSTVASFDSTTGSGPTGVLQAKDGSFYGVTRGGDEPGVFRVAPDGALTSLFRFNAETGFPDTRNNLMEASDGHLYGTTKYGGPSWGGVIYRVRLPQLPFKLTSIERLANGHIHIEGMGVPLASHPLEATTELLLQPFAAIGQAMADSEGRFSFTDTDAASFSRRFYRAVRLPGAPSPAAPKSRER